MAETTLPAQAVEARAEIEEQLAAEIRVTLQLGM